jgi:uncharacterized protein involved in exopolysaccharide biosynthesis
MESSNKNMQLESEDQIDIVALITKVWKSKKLIFKSMLVFGVLGVLVAISSSNQYTASSMFTPNYGNNSSESGGLKGLASLAGINLGSMPQGTSELSPMLYGKVLESVTFKNGLLASPLKNIEGVTSLREYFIQEQQKSSFLVKIKEYIIGLPSKIIEFFKSDTTISLETVDGISIVSEEDFEFFEFIDDILTLSVNDKDGFIEMISVSENPQIAAQVAKNGELILQNQIIAIKTKSSLELLDYLETQYAEKKKLLNQKQDRLSNFKDRNLNISRSSFSDNQTRLESELLTASSVFDNIVTQLEQVKLQVTKDTPVFSIIKPVVFPNEKSGPKRSLILVVCLFLGVVLSIGYILGKEPIENILKEIRTKEKV